MLVAPQDTAESRSSLSFAKIGILDKVHTRAPDLGQDKQCAAMITTLLSTSPLKWDTEQRKGPVQGELEGWRNCLFRHELARAKSSFQRESQPAFLN